MGRVGRGRGRDAVEHNARVRAAARQRRVRLSDLTTLGQRVVGLRGGAAARGAPAAAGDGGGGGAGGDDGGGGAAAENAARGGGRRRAGAAAGRAARADARYRHLDPELAELARDRACPLEAQVGAFVALHVVSPLRGVAADTMPGRMFHALRERFHERYPFDPAAEPGLLAAPAAARGAADRARGADLGALAPSLLGPWPPAARPPARATRDAADEPAGAPGAPGARARARARATRARVPRREEERGGRLPAALSVTPAPPAAAPMAAAATRTPARRAAPARPRAEALSAAATARRSAPATRRPRRRRRRPRRRRRGASSSALWSAHARARRRRRRRR